MRLQKVESMAADPSTLYLMRMETSEDKPPHREWHGTHHAWIFRPHAFRWAGPQIVGINFVPLAKDMRAWFLQQGNLPILSTADYLEIDSYYNPYAYSGSALALAMARVVNAFHDFTTVESPELDETDTEIERIRLYNEIILYSARICEVAIKQLLYCTNIPESRYRRMALGALLESPCPSCKEKNGAKPHQVSLVGTLAHPFHLCLEFEHCAMDHMDLVNRLRNSQAAHSGIQALKIRSIKESKENLLVDGEKILSGFLHMLSHLQTLEERMLDDLGKKAEAIIRLKVNGLEPEDCNFKLVPGETFTFEHPAIDP
ncbi:hypothetical protein [Pseudoxanthomonas sp. YR558]|uniref:hypothetical protein n=1 Tax=Pseudoxanthomonas sp. YR558 TaxID=1881044 RepID=UPI001113C37D|nr:hypothetical protein [Pseudoxanthomonas sp. YR558]